MKRVITAMIVAMGVNVAILSADTVGVGTGMIFYEQPALSRPFSPDAGRYQMLVLADQIREFSGRRVEGVEFDAVAFPEQPVEFENVIIRVAHTSLDKLTPMFDDNFDGNTPVDVLSNEVMTFDWSERGWHRIEFAVPFEYDGTQNLIIDFQHDGNDDAVYLRTTRWSQEPGRIVDGTVTTPPGQARQRAGGVRPRGFLRDYMNAMNLVFQPDDD